MLPDELIDQLLAGAKSRGGDRRSGPEHVGLGDANLLRDLVYRGSVHVATSDSHGGLDPGAPALGGRDALAGGLALRV